MDSREKAWKEFVERYELDVPEKMVENQLQYMTLALTHRMQYEVLAGGGFRPGMGMELAERADEMRKAAYFEAKSELVMKKLLAEQAVSVTPEELEAEAIAMADRQGTTLEMVKRFFGDDLSGLEQDIKERKVLDWVFGQSGN